jgi:hypothetical protein
MPPPGSLETDQFGLRVAVPTEFGPTELVYRKRLRGDFLARLRIVMPSGESRSPVASPRTPSLVVGFRPLDRRQRGVTIPLIPASEQQATEIVLSRHGSAFSSHVTGPALPPPADVLPPGAFVPPGVLPAAGPFPPAGAFLPAGPMTAPGNVPAFGGPRPSGSDGAAVSDGHVAIRIEGPQPFWIRRCEIEGAGVSEDFAGPLMAERSVDAAQWDVSVSGASSVRREDLSVEMSAEGLVVDSRIDQGGARLNYLEQLNGDLYLVAMLSVRKTDAAPPNVGVAPEASRVWFHLGSVQNSMASCDSPIRPGQDGVARLELVRAGGQIALFSNGVFVGGQQTADPLRFGLSLHGAGCVTVHRMYLTAESTSRLQAAAPSPLGHSGQAAPAAAPDDRRAGAKPPPEASAAASAKDEPVALDGGEPPRQRHPPEVSASPKPPAAPQTKPDTSPPNAKAEAVPPASPAGSTAAVRVWTDRSGKYRIQASFLRVEGDSVHLLDEESREREIPLDRLSEADQQYVRGLNRLPTGEAKP